MIPALACNGVRKAYGGVGVLHGVTLHVGAGEVLGLVGANGAGKTTLVDIICGQQSADAGGIVLHDIPLAGPPARRARLGLARSFQRPLLAAELTLRENIACGLAATRLAGWRAILARGAAGIWQGGLEQAAAIDACAARLGLAGLDRAAGAVTLGELRLAELARALLAAPKVMILDEPFSGVGDAGVAAITAALRAVRAAGCAVLLIDHNVDLLTALADRMALLAEGRIVVDADIASCLASPAFRQNYIGVA